MILNEDRTQVILSADEYNALLNGFRGNERLAGQQVEDASEARYWMVPLQVLKDWNEDFYVAVITQLLTT